MTNAVLVSKIFATSLLLLTISGFVSGLLPIGSDFLKTNTILILVHLALTLIFFFVTYTCTNIPIQTLKMVGITYLLTSGIGFIGLSTEINGNWPHVIYLNSLSYFQFGFGIALCVSSSTLESRQNKIVA